MKGSRHWHIVVNENNEATPASLEHEHMVNPGRRHYHSHEFGPVRAALIEQGKRPHEAELMARFLDGKASTTLSFDKEPRPVPADERDIAASLHPEVRRSLT